MDVAVYYFPGWHADPVMERFHGRGWTEWRLVEAASPRFSGHRQPIVPSWGMFDEADPAWMARQVDLGADHGVTAFIFDWYWYKNGPFLERALSQGYLNAQNRSRLKFALMWANHDWRNIHPAPLAGHSTSLLPGAIGHPEFSDLCDYVIDSFLGRPEYLTIDGAPYFSIYELATLVRGLGGIKPAREALDRFRDRARLAGLSGLHLNCVIFSQSLLPGEGLMFDADGEPLDPGDVIRALGFDSATSYVWLHHFDTERAPFPAAPYELARLQYEEGVSERSSYGVPYYPNVTVGWDSSPRAMQTDEFEFAGYPWVPVLEGGTADSFASALKTARDHAALLPGHQMVTINAWNEWTEGSYLLPDDANGTAYLEAVRAVFGVEDSLR